MHSLYGRDYFNIFIFRVYMLTITPTIHYHQYSHVHYLPVCLSLCLPACVACLACRYICRRICRPVSVGILFYSLRFSFCCLPARWNFVAGIAIAMPVMYAGCLVHRRGDITVGATLWLHFPSDSGVCDPAANGCGKCNTCSARDHLFLLWSVT